MTVTIYPLAEVAKNVQIFGKVGQKPGEKARSVYKTMSAEVYGFFVQDCLNMNVSCNRVSSYP